MDEMQKRGYKYKSMENFNNYFQGLYVLREDLIYPEHNSNYLLICFMNLYEKYIRGQKDFDSYTFNKLYDYINKFFDLKSLGIERGGNDERNRI